MNAIIWYSLQLTTYTITPLPVILLQVKCMLDSRNLPIHRLEYKIVCALFRLARGEQCHELRAIHLRETKLVRCLQLMECPKAYKITKCQKLKQFKYIFIKIKWWCCHLVIAITGIQMTETNTRNIARTLHQWGHSLSSVSPLAATHAG